MKAHAKTRISFSGSGNALSATGRHASDTPASMGVDLTTLISLVASGKLTPEFGLKDSWHNLSRAVTALRERKVNGKAVLHVN